MSDPAFITWEELLVIHEESIVQHGGTRGIRDEHLIHSALGAAMNDYFYANANVAGIAAAYAFHIAQAQAFLDGNKRTAIGAALIFLSAKASTPRRVGGKLSMTRFTRSLNGGWTRRNSLRSFDP